MNRRRVLAHMTWFLPVAVAIGLTLGGRESYRYYVSRQHQPCSVATLYGTYDRAGSGFVKTANSHGSFFNLQPMMDDESSHIVFDGTGSVTSITVWHRFAHATSVAVTRTGTYKVNPDCTAEIAWDPPANNPQSLTLAVSRDGNSAAFANNDADVTIAGKTGSQ